MSVDLGGTNFRVCSIKLHGNSTFSLVAQKTPVPHEKMTAKTSQELFSFLAQQIERFLKEHHEDHFETHKRKKIAGEEIDESALFSLGFTFSFPVNQSSINEGTLIRWTKGFDIADAIGKDVCKLLQDAIDALHLPVRVVALVNDTVGTLMARSYTSPGKSGTLLGAIFGTGTNGAYVEKLDRITKLQTETNGSTYDKTTGQMVVNTEWGSFDNALNTLPNTQYDRDLDRESVNPGIQMFEKRISGMFLGEILRRAILALIKDPEVPLFADNDSTQNDLQTTSGINHDSPLYKQWGLDTSFLSTASGDSTSGLRLTRQALNRDLGIHAASAEDAEAVKALSTAIGRRSARLAAVAIGATIIRSGKLQVNPVESLTSSVTDTLSSLGNAIKENLRIVADTITGTTAPSDAKPVVPAVGASSSNEAHITTTSDTETQVIPHQSSDVDDALIDIGVDGSLVEFYPNFEEYIREALREIPEIGGEGERKVRIGIAKDGSGVGAALIALVAEKALANQEEA